MGIYASYYAVSEKQANDYQSWLASDDKDIQQKAFDELFSLRDDEEYDKNHYFDLDKMWDGLHFLLTGCASYDDDESIKTPVQNVLYDGFFGKECLHSDGLHFNDNNRVTDIVKALENINIDELLDNVDFEKFSEADLYPDIWEYDDEYDEICDELRNYFEEFKIFYQNVLNNGKSVFIFIG
ncbi:YfbM family protein [Moraxella oblonga]|uniref:YfbM family protein n=1 Tax=Moraxella oblonga TaxID=200413 RepID=UPI000830D206|nr:YfbM family protein [Moraxella oblonga]